MPQGMQLPRQVQIGQVRVPAWLEGRGLLDTLVPQRLLGAWHVCLLAFRTSATSATVNLIALSGSSHVAGARRCKDFKCSCHTGFTGFDCGTFACPSECSHHGTCFNGTCYCEPGFRGTDCSTHACPNEVCWRLLLLYPRQHHQSQRSRLREALSALVSLHSSPLAGRLALTSAPTGARASMALATV